MSKRNDKNFATRKIDTTQVKVLLARRNWTISDLADEMNVSVSGLYRVLFNERPNVRTTMIDRVASTLGVSVKKIATITSRASRKSSEITEAINV